MAENKKNPLFHESTDQSRDQGFNDSQDLGSQRPNQTLDNTKDLDASKHIKNVMGPEPVTKPRIYKTNRPKCEPRGSLVGESPLYCPKESGHLSNDSLNTELIYYMGAIKELLPAMSVYGDRIKVLPWIRKLFGPEYQASRLRSKRNKYLFHLVLVMMTDTTFGVFTDPPLPNKLLEINQLKPEPGPLARWEKDKYWDELTREMRPEESEMRCSVHRNCEENEGILGNVFPIAGTLLDQEFKFFLYLIKPLVWMIPEIKERAIAALWVLTLSKVRTCACLTMKAIRNDYMQALLGYLQDLRLAGPFTLTPPEHGTTLIPLKEAADHKRPSAFLTRSVINPCSQEAEEFMQVQPIPDSGAFCYIAITGNAGETQRKTNIPMDTTKFENYFAK